MNKLFSFLISLLLLVMLMPVLVPVQAAESPKRVLAEANKLYKQAEKLEGAWVSTGKLIKKAKKALQKKDNKTALKLATKAREEAKLSLAQAKDQMKNWSEPPYIRQ